jgi:hypothetical protein
MQQQNIVVDAYERPNVRYMSKCLCMRVARDPLRHRLETQLQYGENRIKEQPRDMAADASSKELGELLSPNSDDALLASIEKTPELKRV